MDDGDSWVWMEMLLYQHGIGDGDSIQLGNQSVEILSWFAPDNDSIGQSKC